MKITRSHVPLKLGQVLIYLPRCIEANRIIVPMKGFRIVFLLENIKIKYHSNMAIFGWPNCLSPQFFLKKDHSKWKIKKGKYILVQPAACSRCRIQHFPLLDFIQLLSAQPSNLSRHCERQHAKLYWNTKRWHQLASADQQGGWPCPKKFACPQVWQAGLLSHGLVLAVTGDCTVLQVLFNNSQNNLHNFTGTEMRLTGL